MPIIPSSNLTLETGSQMADFSQPIPTDMHLISWVTPDKQPAWISKSRTVMEQDNWSWRSARLEITSSWGLPTLGSPEAQPHCLGQQDSSGTCWKPQWLSRTCGTFLQGHHNAPDGLLITDLQLQSLLPACDPRVPVAAASDTQPLCQRPAGQPETT